MKLLPLLILVMFASASWADVVHLTDGTQVQGKIRQTDEGWAVTQSNGKVVYVPSEKVASIEATRSPDTALAAAEGLASLRRAVDHLTDIHEIITRYEKFIAQTTDRQTLDQAQTDLVKWHERLDQGLVRLGDQWVTADERDRRRQLAQTEALSAKDMIPLYRYKEADKLLQQALTDDPNSAAALYLQGVSFYKQDQVAQARSDFEAVKQIVPDHAPTLNNLAVIAWREKSFVVAADYYDKAMLAAPQVKEVLDNVAEALNAVPDANKQAPVVQQAVRLFAEQDTALQKIAAEHGLYRWGSSWVTAKQLEDLKAAEAKVKKQLDDLQSQYDDLQSKIGQIDSEVDQNLREMHRLEASSTFMDPRGNTITMPMPQVYYQMQNDNQKLAGDKKRLQDQQSALQAKAKQVQQESPAPRFTGVQQLIGVQGVPVRDVGGASAGTAPSFVPASDSATRPAM